MGAGNTHGVMKVSGRNQFAIRAVVGGVVLVAVAALLLQPQAQPLEQRVTAFWDARIQDDDLAAYAYEAYAHTGTLTPTQYVRRRSPLMKYTEYAIADIQEQENEARVRVVIKYQLTVPAMTELSLDSVVQDRWVRLDNGQWYRNNEKNRQVSPSQTAAKQG